MATRVARAIRRSTQRDDDDDDDDNDDSRHYFQEPRTNSPAPVVCFWQVDFAAALDFTCNAGPPLWPFFSTPTAMSVLLPTSVFQFKFFLPDPDFRPASTKIADTLVL